jgi:hypothetical protein
MLLALELIVGMRAIWLPARWKRLELSGQVGQRVATALLRRVRWFEQFSRPRLRSLFHHRLSGSLFGILVFALALTAFVAPPFSGLDTLPALGVLVLALGVVLEDFILAAAGFLIGVLGALLVVGLGGLVMRSLEQLV